MGGSFSAREGSWAARRRQGIMVGLVPLALALAACTTPFRADVTRFQVMPPPAGQSVFIEPAEASASGSLEFQTFAMSLQQQLTQTGFSIAPDRSSASLVARFGYGVGPAREKIASDPTWYGGWGWGAPGWGGWGWGAPGWGGWGGWGWGPDVYSYTVWPSYVTLDIARAADGQSLFEGRAETTQRTDALTVLVPQLVESLFVGFPGVSGETVQVKLTPKKN